VLCLTCGGSHEAHAAVAAVWPAAEPERRLEAQCERLRSMRVLDAFRVWVDATAAGEGKICPGCHTFIQKVEGCHSMTCDCGVGFCWLCGAVSVRPSDSALIKANARVIGHDHFRAVNQTYFSSPAAVQHRVLETDTPACRGVMYDHHDRAAFARANVYKHPTIDSLHRHMCGSLPAPQALVDEAAAV